MRAIRVAGLFGLALLVLTVLTGCGGGSSTSGANSAGSADLGTVTGILALAGSSDTASSAAAVNQTAQLAGGSLPTAALLRHSAGESSVSGERIIKFRSGLSAAEIGRIVGSFGGTVKRKVYGADNTYVVQTDLSTAAAATNSNIVYIENNHIYHTMDIPNDTYYTAYQTWNCGLLNLPNAWSVQKGGSGVTVAVVDTGIATTHPDLQANLVSGHNCIDDDSDPADNSYYNNANRYSHGSHVAGIIGAVTNNGVGVAGVAWNVKIMPVRVLGSDGSGDEATVAAGINWAVANGAKIINLSLGAAETADNGSQAMKDALDNAYSSGVTVVAAAGNEGHYVDFPANYSKVIAVSAVDGNGNITAYSNYGPEVWACAPGGDGSSSYVYSTSYDKKNQTNGYVGMAGTSMACPHIAGLAALLYVHGITTPDAIRERLKNGNTTRSQQYGYGMPDAYYTITGGSFTVTAARVFYALADGTIGAATHPAVNRRFSVGGIPAGQAYICAFIDTDGDEQVSAGDKFAHAGVTSAVGTVITQNLTLTPVTVTAAKSLGDFVKAGFK